MHPVASSVRSSNGEYIAPRIRGWWGPLCLMLVLGVCGRGPAAETRPEARFEPGRTHLNVSPMLEWYVDPTESTTFEEARALAQKGAFQHREADFLRLGVRKAVVWCRLQVRNESKRRRFVLELRNPRMPKVDFFIPKGNKGYTLKHNGTAYPFEKREIQYAMPCAKLTIPPGATRTLWVRARNTGEMRLQFWLWAEAAFVNHALTNYSSELVMVGALLILALFYTAVFFSIRERGYLHLAIFLYAWLLLYLSFTATGSMLLWSNAPLFADRAPTLSVYLVCGTFMLLTNALLEAPTYAPRLSRAAMAMAALSLFGVVYSVIGDNVLRIYGGLVVVLGAVLLSTIIALSIARRGNPSAKLFLVSWCLLFFGGASVVAIRAYAVDPMAFGAQLMNATVVLAVLVWSLDLTARVKGRIREQQRLLEKAVEERTRELREAVQRVKTLHGLLPICASCKKIRDDQGYWSSVEVYIKDRAEVDFTHSICPECRDRLYPREVPGTPEGRASDPAGDA